MPFWQAALGYEPRRDSPTEDLVDPHGRGPGFWFERMKEPRGDGGGAIHIAVWVPNERADTRIAAALAAGGRMVRDQFAPSWWTLADAAGNEIDIATTRAATDASGRVSDPAAGVHALDTALTIACAGLIFRPKPHKGAPHG